jgi:hypothetical protein
MRSPPAAIPFWMSLRLVKISPLLGQQAMTGICHTCFPSHSQKAAAISAFPLASTLVVVEFL